MKNRMHSWATFCRVIGWICMIVGVLRLFFLQGAAADVLIGLAIGCWFSRAVLEWMDGLTDQLIGNRESMSMLREELYQLRRQLAAQPEPTVCEEPEAGEPELTITETGSRRRRHAHDQGE